MAESRRRVVADVERISERYGADMMTKLQRAEDAAIWELLWPLVFRARKEFIFGGGHQHSQQHTKQHSAPGAAPVGPGGFSSRVCSSTKRRTSTKPLHGRAHSSTKRRSSTRTRSTVTSRSKAT